MIQNTLIEMLHPFGPSGSETPIANAIIAAVRPYVDTVRTDAIGNVIATKKGPGKRILFSAHMDTIGYIVLDADKDGFLYVSNLGGIRAGEAASRHLQFANGVQGVICSEPLKDDKPAVSRLFIDIGAKNREEALEKVPVGTAASVRFEVTEMGDLISAPYMDDRAACALLVELLRALDKNTKNEVVAVFSVQEEVGCRGAGVAAFAIEPDIGVALDVTGAGDTPKSEPMAMKVGLGPCVKVKDSGSISTPLVRDGLVAAAKKAGVPFQYEVLPFGGTDASAIMLSRSGIPSGTLSIACRYVHSPVETVSLTDMENAVKLLKVYAEEIVG